MTNEYRLCEAIDGADIMLEAIDEYGPEAQVDMMLEEMSELAKALLKHRRLPILEEKHIEEYEEAELNILEEIADVQIMLDQMKLIWDRYGEEPFSRIEEYRARKLGRLRERVEDARRKREVRAPGAWGQGLPDRHWEE